MGVSKPAMSDRHVPSPDRVGELQRSVGNQALLRALGRRAGSEPPVGRVFAGNERKAADETRAHAIPGLPVVVQRIPTFGDWKKAPGNADKDIGTWVAEATAEFRELYYQVTGEQLTNKTKPPEAIRPIVERFVKAATKAKSLNEDPIGLVPEVVDEMRAEAHKRQLADSRRATAASELSVLTEEGSGVAHHILSFLPITSLVKVRATSRHLRFLAETLIVLRMRVPGMSAVLSVTLQDVDRMMEGTTYAGLHGSSAADSAGLYSGITARPAEDDRVYKTSQLGPGFYMTEGKGDPERRYAKSVAQERTKKTATESRVFRVFINLTGAVTYEVPREEWADMLRDKVPASLAKLCEEPKLLTSAIVENEPTRQIKVNPALFELVRVLPPQEAMDTDFVAWLSAYLAKHPFDYGSISYI